MQKLLTLAILALMGHSLPISAQTSPYLDPSFGSNGRLTYLFQSLEPATAFTLLNPVRALPDGKILVGGYGGDPTHTVAGIVRFNHDGSVDTTFANKGEWVSDDPNLTAITQIILLPDGKMLLGGTGNNGFKLVKLLPEGVYDVTFGAGGKISFYGQLNGTPHNVQDLAVLPDGSIVMYGDFFTIDPLNKYILAKFKPNGALDGTFGQAGSTIIPKSTITPINKEVNPSDMAIYSDNSILLSGGYLDSTFGGVFALHLSANGMIDTTFGNGGVVLLPKSMLAAALFALPGDDFYLLTSTGFSVFPTQSALFKFHKDGSPDTGFADNGHAVFHYASFWSESSSPLGGLLQADGKIVILGGYSNVVGFLGRYNADGSRDSTFGDAGAIQPETTYETFHSGTLQADGKLLALSRFKGPNGKTIGNILRYIPSLSVGVIESPSPLSAAFLYPNPVRESCNLKYELPQASPVVIELMDMVGRPIQTLLQAGRPAGTSEESLALPEGLPAGQYLLRIATNKGNVAVKVVVD